MSDADQDAAPHHPGSGRRSLVVWDGYHGGVDLGVLDRRVVRTTAKPLVHAAADAACIAQALGAGLGVVLPGEAWRNQLELEHPKRAGAFSRLPYALEQPLDVGAGPFTPTFTEDYAGGYLDAQLGAGATLATTPAHVHVEEGGIGRENDVALAAAASKDFISRRAHHPAPGSSLARTLFATIVVQGSQLPGAVTALADAYAGLRVGGYWIVVVNSRQTRRELAGVTDLALTLEESTGRPATVSCVGAAHLALLGHEVSATCIGHHGGTLGFPPEDWAERKRQRAADNGVDDDGIGVHTFHREALGGVRLGRTGVRHREELFRRWPCTCGAHPADEPPAPSQIRSHNLRCTVADAVEICLLSADAARERIAERIELAHTVRAEVGMGSLSPAWSGPAHAVARRAGRGDDAAAAV